MSCKVDSFMMGLTEHQCNEDSNKTDVPSLSLDICNLVDRKKKTHKFIVIVWETLSKKINRQKLNMFNATIAE